MQRIAGRHWGMEETNTMRLPKAPGESRDTFENETLNPLNHNN